MSTHELRTGSTGGIWGHSSVIGGEEYIIATPDNGPDGVRAVQDWFRDNVPVKGGATGYSLLYGYWKGEREQPVIFNVKYWESIQHFFAKQECILWLGTTDARDNRNAYFMRQETHEGRRGVVWSYQGKFTEVSADEAKASDSYTFCPRRGLYWLIKK